MSLAICDSSENHILAQKLINRLIEMLDGFSFTKTVPFAEIDMINVRHAPLLE